MTISIVAWTLRDYERRCRCRRGWKQSVMLADGFISWKKKSCMYV